MSNKSAIVALRRLCKRFLKDENASFTIYTDANGYSQIVFDSANDAYYMPKVFHLNGCRFSRSNDGVYRQNSRVTYRKGQHYSICLMQTYKIISVDATRNKEGWEVNAAYYTGRHLQTPVNPQIKDVVQALVNADELSTGAYQALKHGNLTIWEDELSDRVGSLVTVVHKGKPIVQLELVSINQF